MIEFDNTPRKEERLIDLIHSLILDCRWHLFGFYNDKLPVSDWEMKNLDNIRQEAQRIINFIEERKLLGDYENWPIERLETTVRAERCLKAEGINTIGELLRKKEYEILQIPNLGKKSLREIKESLSKFPGNIALERGRYG